MEEMALRKELEEKKRREGKLAEPKLTPKQKEMLDAQLEKEKAVRQKVAKLKNDVDQVNINFPFPRSPSIEGWGERSLLGLKKPFRLLIARQDFTAIRVARFLLVPQN
jgi:hypothetical protein